MFYDKEINRHEAIRIALDETEATELARVIIFEETGGIWNWTNCANKLNLAPEITVIKKLMK